MWQYASLKLTCNAAIRGSWNNSAERSWRQYQLWRCLSLWLCTCHSGMPETSNDGNAEWGELKRVRIRCIPIYAAMTFYCLKFQVKQPEVIGASFCALLTFSNICGLPWTPGTTVLMLIFHSHSLLFITSMSVWDRPESCQQSIKPYLPMNIYWLFRKKVMIW